MTRTQKHACGPRAVLRVLPQHAQVEHQARQRVGALLLCKKEDESIVCLSSTHSAHACSALPTLVKPAASTVATTPWAQTSVSSVAREPEQWRTSSIDSQRPGNTVLCLAARPQLARYNGKPAGAEEFEVVSNCRTPTVFVARTLEEDMWWTLYAAPSAVDTGR